MSKNYLLLLLYLYQTLVLFLLFFTGPYYIPMFHVHTGDIPIFAAGKIGHKYGS